MIFKDPHNIESHVRREDVVILSTADWDNPFWTNKQHVAVELARQGHRIFYINSLGLRRPSASSQDLRRIFRRLRNALRPPAQVREKILVWSPLVLPFQKYALVRWFNRFVLNALLQFWLRRSHLKPKILWTYNPLTKNLLDCSRLGTLVYHCVDEIKAQPGMPVDLLEKAEEKLVRSADVVFATSQALYESRRVWNPKTYYFPNVADYDHFSRALQEDLPVPSDLADIPSPRIGFVGAISGYKLDFELIRHVAEARPDWSVVLIGKVGEGDPWTDSEGLTGLENLHLLGPRNYDMLPNYLKGFDVALLPNRINDYTRGMFPMKFFEYLAAGKPVVSTELESLRDFSDYFFTGNTPEDFVTAIEKALSGMGASPDERLEIARQHTYAARMEKMMSCLAEVTAGKPSV